MKVTLALLADAANISQEGKLNVLGVFNRILAPRFPSVHAAMMLVLRLECGPAEFEQTRDLRVVLTDEDGKKKGAVELQLEVAAPAGGSPRWQTDLLLQLPPTGFDKPGVYQLSILIGDDEKAAIPLYVEQMEE